MKLLIAGDFYISDAYQNTDLIDQSVIDLFQQADYRMLNLEAPIIANDPKNKILKTGPHLRMSDDTAMSYLKQLKVDTVALANNHILDYGTKGLSNTFDSLNQNKINYVGAGKNLLEASKPLILKKDGMRIAILNFCENEWSIAEEDKPGANPIDIIDNVNQIKAAKSNNDKVICIIHGGHEYYHLPSPRMQKQYRFYVDNGADAIVGHHTHCIGGCEVYNEIPIFYSLGNFIFTRNNKNPVWYYGLIATLEIIQNKKIEFKLHPTIQKIRTFKTKLLEGIEEEKTLAEVKNLSETINNNKLLIQEWYSFINQKEKQYLNAFSPVHFFKTKYITSAVKKLSLHKLFMNKKHYKMMMNLIRCEAHKDASIEAIKVYLKN